MKVRTRFAPSPTGFMHIGNLRTALYAYLFAKANGGDFILRIEDTDTVRKVEGAEELVYRTLERAGIVPDESPAHPGAVGPYVQSQRKAIYAQYAHRLVELGGAYYCFCDKQRLESLTDENGNRKYDKHCLKLSKEEVRERLERGDEYVIRQNIPESGMTVYEDMVFGRIEVDCADMEDNVLLKSDGMPTYNFANVVDDHLMGITHVIRGTEYLSSTPKYNLLYDAFGWERPQYMHLPPIMKDEHRKLSKRYGDANFEDFLAKGFLPKAIVNYIALLGWNPKDNREMMSMQEMIESFRVEGISRSGSIFDEEKMRWLNACYLKAMSEEEFWQVSQPYFAQSAIWGKYDARKFAPLLPARIEVLSEIPEKVNFLAEYGPFDAQLYVHKKMKTDEGVARAVLPLALQAIEGVDAFTPQAVHDALVETAESHGFKKGQMLWCVRVALTGQPSTPGGAVEMADVLGKEESVARLKSAIARLG